jgi:hypothetical protein
MNISSTRISTIHIELEILTSIFNQVYLIKNVNGSKVESKDILNEHLGIIYMYRNVELKKGPEDWKKTHVN